VERATPIVTVIDQGITITIDPSERIQSLRSRDDGTHGAIDWAPIIAAILAAILAQLGHAVVLGSALPVPPPPATPVPPPPEQVTEVPVSPGARRR
jgi:hypothetical protein